MNLVGISYNFNFFTKNNFIKADSDSIYKLMPFITDGFMPTTGDEIGEEGERYKVIRVQKENDDINISITFAKKAILVQITKDKEILESSYNEFDRFRVEKQISNINE